MTPEQPPRPGQPTPALFRQRLTIVAIAFIVAQVMYILLAAAMLQGHFKATASGQSRGPFTAIVFLVGILAAVVSFLVVRAMASRQPTDGDFATVAPAIQKQFFVGFALSEVASLAGLLIFFLYADLKTLFTLVCVASASIAAHFLRVKKILEDIERTQR
jgi:hypothetical protein